MLKPQNTATATAKLDWLLVGICLSTVVFLGTCLVYAKALFGG